MLPDTGRNYLTKFYSDEWMASRGLAEGTRRRVVVGDVLAAKRRTDALIAVSSRASVADAICTSNSTTSRSFR